MKAILTFLLGVGMVTARAEETSEQRCREFLTHFPAVYRVSSGTAVSFTGRFTPIPADLAADLQREFGDYTFHIAEMTWVHWGPEHARLLIIDEPIRKSVCSYLWDVWFADAPDSFGRLFNQSGQPIEVAKARLTALARLLCFQMGWTLGEVTLEDGVLFAPLINPEKSVWRIIKCRVTPDFSPGAMSFIRPQDKSRKAEK